METVTDLTARLDMLVPTPAQTAFVIAHEASHIKHNDALAASLTLPAYILLCFHSTTLASRLLSSRLGTVGPPSSVSVPSLNPISPTRSV